MSGILETKRERLERIRDTLNFIDPTRFDNGSMLTLSYGDFLFLERLARETIEVIDENKHLRYRLDDEIWHDFKRSQEIWDLERKLLIEQRKCLERELKQLIKDREVQG